MTWAAVLGFLKKIPDWVWWLFLIIAAATFIDMKARSEERKKVNAKRDKESAEVESQVISQITENSNEMVRQSDAVRSRPAIVELPDGTQDLPPYHYRD